MATIGKYQGVDINAGTDAEVAAQVAKINAGIKPIAPNLTPNPTINPGNIGKAYPYTAPQPDTSPTGAGLTLSTDNALSQNQVDNTQTPQTETQQQKSSARDYFNSLIGRNNSQAADISKIQTEAGLAEKRKKAQALSTELDSLDKNFRDQIKAIKANPQGKFGSQVDNEVNQAQDRYINNRANIALTYKVANEDYQGAQQIVDDKVSNLKEQNQQGLQLYQAWVQTINNDLTDSEKLIAQANIADKQRQAQTVEDIYRSTLSNAINNNAPASVLSAIDTASRTPGATGVSIAQAAGKYGTDILGNAIKQAQLSNIYSEIDSRNTSNVDASQILAFAQQYASTGQIPSGIPKGTFGLISQAAGDLPKGDGELVDNKTNIKSGSVKQGSVDAISALYDLTKKLDQANTLFTSISSKGGTGLFTALQAKTAPNAEQTAYKTLRSEIVDLLARARTGAAINASEEALYASKLPTLSNRAFGLGAKGTDLIGGLKNSISGKLNTNLQTNGVSLYGYSKVKIDGKEYTVGDVVSVPGQNGAPIYARINANGTVTRLN